LIWIESQIEIHHPIGIHHLRIEIHHRIESQIENRIESQKNLACWRMKTS
jgi:hypothetical protein